MTIQPTTPSLTITFNKAELEYIRGLTQNALASDVQKPIRLELFVAVSKALGYNMNADGTTIRSHPMNGGILPL